MRHGRESKTRDERGRQRTRQKWLPTPTFSQGSRLRCLGCSAMDIFILAGQSNMAGRGNTQELPAPYIAADRQGEYERTSRTHDNCCKLEHNIIRTSSIQHTAPHTCIASSKCTGTHSSMIRNRERLQWSWCASVCPGINLIGQSKQKHANT